MYKVACDPYKNVVGDEYLRIYLHVRKIFPDAPNPDDVEKKFELVQESQ